MGTDKALLRLDRDGPTLLERALGILSELVDDRFVVSRISGDYPGTPATVHGDLYGTTGVLGGIATALRHARHERCLIVSCDMPFLNIDLLRWMSTQGEGSDVVVPALPLRTRQGGDVTYQTLHAIYSRRCLEPIERRLDAGERKIISFFHDVVVHPVPVSAIERFDPHRRSFFSVNTPEAFEEARRVYRSGLENENRC
jgi:molybdenum cofactor guanylyltransferase